MKFTEGYWLRSERVKEHYAAQVWEMKEVDGGMSLLVPLQATPHKGNTVNVPCLTLTFRAAAEDTISVKATHFKGYDTRKPKFELSGTSPKVEISETDDEYMMKTGKLTVRVRKNPFSYSFESDGKVITACGFRNLGYMEWDKEPSTMLPSDH